MQIHKIKNNRIRQLNNCKLGNGSIVYWMQRDQRINDNWALLTAQNHALSENRNLIILFNIVDNFLDASFRQYDFMIKGLKQVEVGLQKYNIPFIITLGDPTKEIPKVLNEINSACLYTDFNPLNIIKQWHNKLNKKINIPFYQVDAHNIIPCWVTSNKTEFAARTIRPKINNLLPEYLKSFPKLKKMHNNQVRFFNNNWDKIISRLKINFDVKPINWLTPGEQAAKDQLDLFIKNRLSNYDELRNDPNSCVLSNLSPYLHFGQISSQKIALEINKIQTNTKSKDSFLEELIVRKELSDNYCHFTKSYDKFEGFHNWAKTSLIEHLNDKREYIYSTEQFEYAQTHDPLWNAAQKEMFTTGKMFGFMRMYWAKKIMEWSTTPIQAQATAIYLNDKYSLDGRDPNGYTGIAWSIGGVHDRAWSNRPIFGKIRYMNFNGCKRKFDVQKYIIKHGGIIGK